MKSFLMLYAILCFGLFTGIKQDPELQQSMARGQVIYSDFCVNCHMETGEGIPMAFPPLAKSDYLANNRDGSILAVKYGLQGEIEVNGIIYNSMMNPMGLEDEEVVDVMNYIMNSWGNTQENRVTLEEVSNIEN